MPILGGSPLGLIQVESRPTRDGMSTFNGGRSRNVNVNLYNAGKEADKEKIVKTKQPAGSDKGGAFSLFTGSSFVKPWANIQIKEGEIPRFDTTGYSGVSRRSLHNNDVYDTSILNIIEKTSGTKARLRPTDFAYLKDLGVYPNNRLVIARRFSVPQHDDIFVSGNSPLAVLVTWRKLDEDFLEISFGEKWIEAKASFTDLLNKITEDLLGGKKASSLVGGLGAVPIPGWSEALQREVLAQLGVVEGDATTAPLPAGDPNLIKEAKRRDTVPYGEANSGLKCTVNVKMIVEYEQKFISGIDPTIAYQDLIQNALRFATSVSRDWGLSGDAAKTIMRWADNPSQAVQDIIEAVKKGVEKAKDAVIEALKFEISEADDGTPDNEAPTSEQEELQEQLKKVEKLLEKVVKTVLNSVDKTVQKYKEEVQGIARALSGLPSTPWHVTIGNPLRPIFCAGDMYMSDNLTMTLGSTLAFNDLPSSLKLDFILTNARPWGLQEIFAKFNTGNLRTVNTVNDASQLRPDQSPKDGTYTYQKNAAEPVPPTAQAVDAATNRPNDLVTGNPGQSINISSNPLYATGDPQQSQTKEGSISLEVNKDPNSTKGPVSENSDILTKKPVNKPDDPESPKKQGTGDELQQQKNEANSDAVSSANATSKKNYVYTISREGSRNNPKGPIQWAKRLKVVDKDGVEQLNKTYDGLKTDSEILSEAKTSLNDL
jgi:hypothetical protein